MASEEIFLALSRYHFVFMVITFIFFLVQLGIMSVMVGAKAGRGKILLVSFVLALFFCIALLLAYFNIDKIMGMIL